MNWYSSPPEPEILWIKDLNQLNEKYPYNYIGKKFVFAKYEIIDVTHDNKLLKVTASIKKAEEKRAKQLAYKKHADCEVVIRENDLQSKLDLDLSNVYGTDAYNKKFNELRLSDGLINRNVIVVDRNINMVLKVINVKLDKFIITKSEKEMRLTILVVEDRNNNKTTITLFDSSVAEKISENQFIKITNAEVNMRKFRNSDDALPEGLKIPSWATLELIDVKEFPTPIKSQIPEPEIAERGKCVVCNEPASATGDNGGLYCSPQCEEKDSEVRCEQVNCSGCGKDQQYYCAKCDMELCSICIFEHRKNTSISGLECDLEICYGSRKQNTMAVIQN